MDDGSSFSMLLFLKLSLAIFLVFLNAVFVAAEFSFVKVRPTRLAQLVAEGNRTAKVAQTCVNNIDAYLSVTQLGITISSLGLGWLGEPVIATLLEPLLLMLGITSPAVLHSTSFVIAFTLVTFLHVVFGELIPKSLAIQRAEAVTLWLAMPMRMFYYLFYPFMIVFNGTANKILWKLGVRPASEHEESHSEEELQMLVSESYRSGHLETNEWRLLQNVFAFEKKVVRDVMVPRPDVVFLECVKDLAENKDKAIKSGHTRFPYCDGDKDHVVGLIHIKDLMQLDENFNIDSILRKMIIIPEGLSLEKLLREFQKSHQHMALVVDEYGGTSGIVTMENILEELVGEIQDEFDHEQPEVIPEKNGSYLVDGRLPLEEATEMFSLSLDNREEDYDTLGGYVFGKLDKSPRVGDKIDLPSHSLEVAETNGRRIRRIRLNILNQELDEELEASKLA